MDSLLLWDFEVFTWINYYGQNQILDATLPFLRNRYIWFPLYIFILAYLFTNYPLRRAVIFILSLISLVIITDLTSGRLFKKTIQRPRPCQENFLEEVLVERVRCSQSYSFPSAHATNHFGIACFLLLLLGIKKRIWHWIFYLWAGIISYAQVYVGLHFPLDVIGGALLGVLLARMFFAGLVELNILQRNQPKMV